MRCKDAGSIDSGAIDATEDAAACAHSAFRQSVLVLSEIPRLTAVLRGAVAAAVTPLRDGLLDPDAIVPYVDFLAGHGVDGLLALGTTGEGVMFPPAHRREIAQAFVDAAAGRIQVAVHAGAQTTHDTVALAEHAASRRRRRGSGDRAAVLRARRGGAARAFRRGGGACAPRPFYLYEFEARSGYAIPIAVVERLREQAPNLAGLKVSDSPWDKVSPYLLDGLDVFVGAEALLVEGLAAGAAGAVSGLAASFPDAVVPLVREPSPELGEIARALRVSLSRLPVPCRARRPCSACAACRSPPRCARRCAA